MFALCLPVISLFFATSTPFHRAGTSLTHKMAKLRSYELRAEKKKDELLKKVDELKAELQSVSSLVQSPSL